jgi:hypothetical protein
MRPRDDILLLNFLIGDKAGVLASQLSFPTRTISKLVIADL